MDSETPANDCMLFLFRLYTASHLILKSGFYLSYIAQVVLLPEPNRVVMVSVPEQTGPASR